MLALLGQLDESGGLGGPNGPIFSTAAGTAAVNTDAGSLLFSLLVDAGDQSSFTDLCDTYAGGFDGGYFCLRPDGGFVGATLTATAAPTLETHSVCGNGPYCAQTDRIRLNGSSQYYSTGNVASPTQSFTDCVIFEPTSTGAVRLLGKTVGTSAVSLGLSSLFPTASVSKAGGGTTTVSSPFAVAARSRNLVCARYKFVADGTSLLSLWLNGTSVGTPSTTAVGPPAVVSNAYVIGSTSASAFFAGTVSNAFHTEVYLDDANLLAMAGASLGKLTASIGGAITTTRATARSCFNAAASEVTFLWVNLPCITQAAIDSGGTVTQKLQRAEEFDNATWTEVSDGVTAIPTVTANTTDVISPHGDFTAEKVVFPAVSGAGTYSLLRQTATGTAAGWSWGPWMRTLAGSVTLYTGASISTPTYYSTTCTITTTWARCELRNKTLTAATWNFDIGVNLNDPAQVAQAGGTVYVWGAEAEVGPFLQGYSPSTSAQVTRNGDSPTAANPLLGVTGSPWCTSVAIESPDATTWVDSSAAGSQRDILSWGTNSTANTSAIFIRSDVARGQQQVYNSAAVALSNFTPSSSLTAGPHTFSTTNAGAAMTIAFDGVNQALSVSGSGTGVIATQPATLYLGTDSSLRGLKGRISAIKMGDSLVRCTQ